MKKQELEKEAESLTAQIRKLDTDIDVCDDALEITLLKTQREALKVAHNTLKARIVMAEEREKDEKYVEYNALMSFGMAIIALRYGLIVQRLGWNGKGLYVFKQVGANIGGDIVPKMTSLSDSAKNLILATKKKTISYHHQCLIYDSKTGLANSWVPSISDVFAEDWLIVNPEKCSDGNQE